MPQSGSSFSELALFGEGSLLAISGIGCAAAAGAARALTDAGVAALMTFGLSGGLDPALVAGQLFLPAQLIAPNGARLATCRSWRERVAAAVSPVPAVHEGSLLTSRRALQSLADKAVAFHDTGAAAVDMESAAVAEVAFEHKLPFIAVRAIVDSAAEMLPRAVVDASRSGSVQIARLIVGLVLAPGEIPALLRLAQRYRSSMRSLRAAAESGALAPLDSDTFSS